MYSDNGKKNATQLFFDLFFSLIKELQFKHKPGILKIWVYKIRAMQVSRFLWNNMFSKANHQKEIKHSWHAFES